MSERVPEGWEFVSLSQLDLDISDGNYSSKYPTSDEFVKVGVPFLRANNIGSIKVNPKNIRFISNKKHAELKKGHLKNGDILISTRGEIGKVCVVQDAFVDANINAQLVRVNGGQKLNSFFLFHILRSDSSVQQLADLQTGTALKQLPVGNFLKLTIPFMPYREQKKIASILTSVDEVIETTQKQIDKLQDLKKATMNELLTKGIGHTEFKDSELGRIPKSWEVRKLEELVDPERSVTYGIVQAGKHIETGIPYIRVSDMKFDVLHPKDMLRTSNEIAVKFQRSKVQEGDIVYALRGDVGRVLMVPKSLEGANLTQGTALISKSKQIDTKFFIWCLNSDFVQSQTNDLAKGSTFVEMTLGNLKSIKTTLPPKSEQLKISQILNSISNKISCQKQKLSQTQSLKKSLMQDLLTGKVRVQVN